MLKVSIRYLWRVKCRHFVASISRNWIRKGSPIKTIWLITIAHTNCHSIVNLSIVVTQRRYDTRASRGPITPTLNVISEAISLIEAHMSYLLWWSPWGRPTVTVIKRWPANTGWNTCYVRRLWGLLTRQYYRQWPSFTVTDGQANLSHTHTHSYRRAKVVLRRHGHAWSTKVPPIISRRRWAVIGTGRWWWVWVLWR